MEVSNFKYLGRVLAASDENWPEVVDSFRKARKRWEFMSSVLGQEVEDPHNSGGFYKELVQANLLFGTESWVVSPCIWRTLGGFCHRVSRRLAKIQPKREVTASQFIRCWARQ